MTDLSNVYYEHSQAWRTSIDDLYEWRLLDYPTNQVEADPIAQEAVEGDNVVDNVEEVESDVIYVGRIFNDSV